jgi:hypothetical protein
MRQCLLRLAMITKKESEPIISQSWIEMKPRSLSFLLLVLSWWVWLVHYPSIYSCGNDDWKELWNFAKTTRSKAGWLTVIANPESEPLQKHFTNNLILLCQVQDADMLLFYRKSQVLFSSSFQHPFTYVSSLPLSSLMACHGYTIPRCSSFFHGEYDFPRFSSIYSHGNDVWKSEKNMMIKSWLACCDRKNHSEPPHNHSTSNLIWLGQVEDADMLFSYRQLQVLSPCFRHPVTY